MNAALPAPLTPLSVTDDTVTFSRMAWDAHVAALEDMADRAAVATANKSRAELGDAVFRQECITDAELARILEGTSTVTIYRERLAMTRRALAAAAGVAPSYLTEIEQGKKPGSIATMKKLAAALGISLVALTT